VDPFRYTIELIDPLNCRRLSLPVRADQKMKGGDPRAEQLLLNDEDEPVGLVSADWHRKDLWRVLVVMAPTEPEDASLPGIESGNWTLVIRRDENATPLEQPIQSWIQRAGDPKSLPARLLRNLEFAAPGSARQDPAADCPWFWFSKLATERGGCLAFLVPLPQQRTPGEALERPPRRTVSVFNPEPTNL
jgi:hypothetical protein